MSDAIKEKTAKFFAQYPLKSFDKRQLLLQPQSEPANIFYLVEGRVSQYDIAPSGREIVVNVFKPGAFFPMAPVMNHTLNRYFFEASTKVIARAVPAADVVNFLRSTPEVLFDLLARVYKGVDGVLRRMAHLMAGNAKSRLLFELLNAAYRFGESQADGSIFIDLKENDFARHSGLARETVSRILQELKAAGLVKIERGGLTITSLAQLEAMLDSML
ncbi:MAG TPA: Crp/Fnr family transcriptional regulator [Candidatus Saccharimonadales bacterium]|nr:Crp/Fnr family transcriptional regulator [Candidatus Saccharimonadales bacterium]